MSTRENEHIPLTTGVIKYRMHPVLIFFFALIVLFVIVAIWIQIYLEKKNICFPYIVQLEKYSEYVATLNTILVSLVVLLYSIMDNRKEGIPHRMIVSCSFGSYSVPIYFFTVMILLLSTFLFQIEGLYIMELASVILEILFQFILIYITLASSSFSFCMAVICNSAVEFLAKEEVQNQNKVERLDCLNYLEVAISSDELITDRMLLVKKLLMAPFFKHVSFVRDSEVKFERLMNCKKEILYSYYYENLECALEDVKTFTSDNRNRVYGILYYFLSYLGKEYENISVCLCDEQKRSIYYNLLTITSSVINAVVSSEVKEAEAFCERVFMDVIPESIINEQLILFIMHQELLYRANQRPVNMAFLSAVPNIDRQRIKTLGIFLKMLPLWKIWTKARLISEENSIQYFWNFADSFTMESCNSMIAYYAAKRIFYKGELGQNADA